MNRILGVLATTLALTIPASAAVASSSASADVHAVGADRWCGGATGTTTIHQVRLVNRGDQRRGVRVVVRYREDYGDGISQSAQRRIAAGDLIKVRARLGVHQEAVMTVRSQGQVIARVHMIGNCQRLGGPR